MRNRRRESFQRELLRSFWSIKSFQDFKSIFTNLVKGISQEPMLEEKTKQKVLVDNEKAQGLKSSLY